MTEDRQTDATAGTGDSTGDPVDTSGAQTVEEVEAIYKARISGKDRAHNAETAALRAQIDALKAAPATPPVGESPEAARVRELETALANEQKARALAELQAKYPEAADTLGDSIVNVPVEKVAAIEARFADVIAPRMDRNAAPRQPAGVPGQSTQGKPLNEKTKDELLADLRAATPQIQQELREGIVR